MSKIVRKQIAFNLEDPFQKQLFDHVNRMSTNFSSYGKSLIIKDMSGSWQNSGVEVLEEGPTINSDIIKGFI